MIELDLAQPRGWELMRGQLGIARRKAHPTYLPIINSLVSYAVASEHRDKIIENNMNMKALAVQALGGNPHATYPYHSQLIPSQVKALDELKKRMIPIFKELR